MLPVNEARGDLVNTRKAVGGFKPVSGIPRPPNGSPVRPPAPQGTPQGVPVRPQLPQGTQPSAPGMSSRPPLGAPAPAPGLAPPTAPMVNAQVAPTPISSFGPGNDLLSSQINPGNSGVNRTQLAENQLKSWDAQDAPRMAGEMRAVGQNAAKFGRIGAGMTTNDLTGIEATHNRDRMSFQNDLASNLASDTVNDARANNNEMRTERGYQTDRSDKAQQDAINQKILEDQLLNSRFGRAQSRTGTGYANDPSGLLSEASGRAGADAAGSTQAGVGLLRGRPKVQQAPDYTELLQRLIAQQSGG